MITMERLCVDCGQMHHVGNPHTDRCPVCFLVWLGSNRFTPRPDAVEFKLNYNPVSEEMENPVMNLAIQHADVVLGDKRSSIRRKSDRCSNCLKWRPERYDNEKGTCRAELPQLKIVQVGPNAFKDTARFPPQDHDSWCWQHERDPETIPTCPKEPASGEPSLTDNTGATEE